MEQILSDRKNHLRKPMQGKSRVENINRLSRKKSPVKSSGNTGSKIRTVFIGRQTFLHSATTLTVVGVVVREELEKCVEVIGREIGKKGGELGWLVSRCLTTLFHVIDNNVDDVDGVGAAGTTKVHHYKGHAWWS